MSFNPFGPNQPPAHHQHFNALRGGPSNPASNSFPPNPRTNQPNPRTHHTTLYNHPAAPNGGPSNVNPSVFHQPSAIHHTGPYNSAALLAAAMQPNPHPGDHPALHPNPQMEQTTFGSGFTTKPGGHRARGKTDFDFDDDDDDNDSDEEEATGTVNLNIHAPLKITGDENMIMIDPSTAATRIALAVVQAVRQISGSAVDGIPMIDAEGNPRGLNVKVKAEIEIMGSRNVLGEKAVMEMIPGLRKKNVAKPGVAVKVEKEDIMLQDAETLGVLRKRNGSKGTEGRENFKRPKVE